jgi:hypothetical protein
VGSRPVSSNVKHPLSQLKQLSQGKLIVNSRVSPQALQDDDEDDEELDDEDDEDDEDEDVVKEVDVEV